MNDRSNFEYGGNAAMRLEMLKLVQLYDQDGNLYDMGLIVPNCIISLPAKSTAPIR